MNFRVFASGLLFLVLFQILVAAGVVLYVVHCDTPGGGAGLQDTTVASPGPYR